MHPLYIVMMEVMVTDPPEGMKYEESCTSLAHLRDARRFSKRLTNYIPPGGDEVRGELYLPGPLPGRQEVQREAHQLHPPGRG